MLLPFASWCQRAEVLVTRTDRPTGWDDDLVLNCSSVVRDYSGAASGFQPFMTLFEPMEHRARILCRSSCRVGLSLLDEASKYLIVEPISVCLLRFRAAGVCAGLVCVLCCPPW